MRAGLLVRIEELLCVVTHYFLTNDPTGFG